jgi:hypothetical protein
MYANPYIGESRSMLDKALYDNYDYFVNARQKKLPTLLDDLNKTEMYLRMAQYQKIKHNNLFAFDFIVDNCDESKKASMIIRADEKQQIIWRALSVNELHSDDSYKYTAAKNYIKKNFMTIYTGPQFIEKFGEDVYDLFKQIHAELDHDRQIYLIYMLIDMIMYD